MNTAPQFQPISVVGYLAGERKAGRKHEFVGGDVHAMADGTVQHNRIASNMTGLMHAQLRGKPCQVFNSDMKVRIRMTSGTRFYYPDVSIVCQPNVPNDAYQDAPVVVVEVISDATRRTDEYANRDAYLNVDSLNVYLLIEQNFASALVYRRADHGFERDVYSGLAAAIDLPEVGCQLSMSDIYENVDFVPPKNEDE